MSRFVDIEPWECSDEEYLEADYVGSSTICRVLGYDGPSKKTGDLGTACHLAVLQPELFSERVVCPPPEVLPGSGKGQRERRTQWDWENRAKIILTPSEYQTAKSMRAALFDHPLLAKGVRRESTIIERPMRCIDSVTGLQIRLRPDGLCEDRAALWDLKMSESPSYFAFKKKVERYAYFVQDALYCDVVEALLGRPVRWWWIVAGNKPPYRCAAYEDTEQWRMIGRRFYSAGLDLLAHQRVTQTRPQTWWSARPKILDDPPAYLDAEATLHEQHAARLCGLETV